MWIILGFLFSASVFALDPSERLIDVKILQVLPGNIVKLNRGIEDGIVRHDHAQLSNLAGYSSRAICLKASQESSYWKIYRVPNAKAFSMDYTYTITGIADKEVPARMEKWRDEGLEIPGI